MEGRLPSVWYYAESLLTGGIDALRKVDLTVLCGRNYGKNGNAFDPESSLSNTYFWGLGRRCMLLVLDVGILTYGDALFCYLRDISE